jgi:alkyl sulfatase BDS1-like metallo-beta-lactamase superfamily hydrolase
VGIKLVIGSQPGETPDELYVWVPDKKVLFVGENIYELFPNLYSMRGTKYRDVSLWIDSLDKLRSFNATYMVPSHTRPVEGQQNVYNILTSYRDGIAYIYDQTIRNINKGLDPEDLAQQVKLPPYLANNSWLQERYGQISWMPRGIYSGEVGWNNGDPTWFNPVTKAERGQLIIEGFGGLNQTISKIKQAITDGKYNWAAELATCVLYKYPDNQEAKLLKAQAFRILGWMNPTSGARNWYLTNARVLEGKLDAAVLSTLHGAQERILNTPTDILLNLARFHLDPEKSGDMNMTLSIRLNDTNEGYTLQIRKAVLVVGDGRIT